MFNNESFISELIKMGAISDDQARQSLDHLDSLERNKPGLGQVARYAGIGAVAGPAISAIGNVVKGVPHANLGGKTMLRGIAGDAIKGAIGGGVVPLIRHQADRRAEIGTLRNYLQERELPPAAPGPAGTEVMGKVAKRNETR